MEPAAVLSSELSRPIFKRALGQWLSHVRVLSPQHSPSAGVVLHIHCFLPLLPLSMETSGFTAITMCPQVWTSPSMQWVWSQAEGTNGYFLVLCGSFSPQSLCGLLFALQILPRSRGYKPALFWASKSFSSTHHHLPLFVVPSFQEESVALSTSPILTHLLR